MAPTTILAVNGGSSSLKFGLFSAEGGAIETLCSGAAEEIGASESSFWIRAANGETLQQAREKIADERAALRVAVRALRTLPFPAPQAIGHRIVHGGPHLLEHQEITARVLHELEAAVAFAPLHVPAALAMIREAQQVYPGLRQFACLDTAFHRTLPEAASRFALPRELWDAGVRRYGFHGLSCESVLHALGAHVPPRVIIAHLGSGASITAVAGGASVDTTMGFTPTGGIVMGTRSGDLDPGVLLYLIRSGSSLPQLEKLLDKESGLLGISGLSSDMRELHKAAGNPQAQCAVEIFCRSAKKAIGSFAAVLGGLDLLTFTGGIGERDAVVRQQICAGLEAIGVSLEPRSNAQDLPEISPEKSAVRVRVIHSEEDMQIARHTARLFRAIPADGRQA